MTLLERATEPVYMEDAQGIRRLVAAPGDPVPANAPVMGLVTPAEHVVVGEPLDGYDALTEDEVVELLPGLDEDTLEDVRAYERAHLARGAIHRYGLRSTVVRGARDTRGTVPAESTSTGYASMSPADLQAEVDRRIAAGRAVAVSGTGASGNVTKKDLVAALQADDAKTPTT